MMTIRRTALLSLFLLIVGALLIASAQRGEHDAHAQTPGCWPPGVLMGALVGQPKAAWCYPPVTGPTTHQSGANSWLDDFNHGLNIADLGTGYKTYDIGSVGLTRHWRHAEHWMVDIAGKDADGSPPPWDLGTSMMRPDRSFRFENGLLVVEAEVAAGVVEYQGVAWPELIVTTADHPTELRPNSTYAYQAFPGFDTIGCRLQADGSPTCALLDNTRGGDSTARTWEISHFQCGNTQGPYCAEKFGGHPSVVPGVFRFCRGNDPDTNCRDKFRWEIRKDELKMFVNGTLYMRHARFAPSIQIPDRFLNAPVYVYFGQFVYKSGVDAVRFHWDHIAVNPGGAPGVPTATPVVPTGTPVVPTATIVVPPTTTVVPVATATLPPASVCERVMRLDGQLVYVSVSLSECVD